VRKKKIRKETTIRKFRFRLQFLGLAIYASIVPVVVPTRHNMTVNLTLYTVTGAPPTSAAVLTCVAILILDSDGNRILGKYYTPPHLPPATTPQTSGFITTPQPNAYPTLKEQRAFERGLFGKTKKQTSDVILYDNKLCLYKQAVDATIYVIGGAEENEIMLYLVVVALKDCLDVLLKYPSPTFPLSIGKTFSDCSHSIDKRSILENYDLVALCIDEICDDGYTPPTMVLTSRIILETDPANICSRVTKPPATDITNVKVELTEQGLINAYKSFREVARERNWI
jgi:coatomer subunit zeta